MIFQAKNIHYTTFVDTLPALFLKESRKSSNTFAESYFCQAKAETQVTEHDVILRKAIGIN